MMWSNIPVAMERKQGNQMYYDVILGHQFVQLSL